MSTAYVAVVGSTGDDLTNVQTITKSKITVHTAKSLSPEPANRVRRPAYFVVIGVL